MASKREQELEAIVRRLMPATRDVLWCALVWNDHNYEYSDLTDKANRAATALGYPRGTIGNQIDRVNEFLAHVDSVLSEGKSDRNNEGESK